MDSVSNRKHVIYTFQDTTGAGRGKRNPKVNEEYPHIHEKVKEDPSRSDAVDGRKFCDTRKPLKRAGANGTHHKMHQNQIELRNCLTTTDTKNTDLDTIASRICILFQRATFWIGPGNRHEQNWANFAGNTVITVPNNDLDLLGKLEKT